MTTRNCSEATVNPQDTSTVTLQTTAKHNNSFIKEYPIDTLDCLRRWLVVMSLADCESVLPHVEEDRQSVMYEFMQDAAHALDHVMKSLK